MDKKSTGRKPMSKNEDFSQKRKSSEELMKVLQSAAYGHDAGKKDSRGALWIYAIFFQYSLPRDHYDN